MTQGSLRRIDVIRHLLLHRLLNILVVVPDVGDIHRGVRDEKLHGGLEDEDRMLENQEEHQLDAKLPGRANKISPTATPSMSTLKCCTPITTRPQPLFRHENVC